MACFVNDCAANLSPEEARERYLVFHEKIRAKHPTLPLLLLTSIRRAAENHTPNERTAAVNAVIEQTYETFRSRGDRNVHLLDCRPIIGLDRDHPSVDGVHLTDLGFKRLAEGIAPTLRQLLGLTP